MYVGVGKKPVISDPPACRDSVACHSEKWSDEESAFDV
jgi:hypothetical protein